MEAGAYAFSLPSSPPSRTSVAHMAWHSLVEYILVNKWPPHMRRKVCWRSQRWPPVSMIHWEGTKQRERCMERSPEKTRHKLPRVLPQLESHRTCSINLSKLWEHVRNVFQGGSLETKLTGTLLGTIHTGTLCLECTKIADISKKSRCWAQITLFA